MQLDFREIKLTDAQEFEFFLQRMDSLSCEMNFGNFFMWREETGGCFANWQGRLLVVFVNEQTLQFPLGEYFCPSDLSDIVKYLKKQQMCDGTIYDIPPQYVTNNPDLAEFFTIEQSPDYSDYIYELEAFAQLRGSKLRKKRNLVKQFLNEYQNIKVDKITPDNLQECCQLSRELSARLAHSTSLLQEESTWPTLCKNMFAPELKLDSLTVSVDGKVIGFSIWSPLGKDCFDVHFEKVDHTYKGAPQFLIQQLGERLYRERKFVNREQDLGIEGLRHAKHSLDPAQMYERCILKLRD